MDSQDHKTTTATSAGHEGHGAHICHRCGWPFPNPHPSAKHRRAHKKVCGTIEGYHVIQSEDGDTHLAVTVDEDASDDDVHSPSPKLVKQTSSEVTGSGGIGEKANKSEDDVFSDAATGFSDSGVSQRSEESFEAFTGNTDHKGKDDAGQQLMVAEKSEQINDQTNSSQTRESGVINDNVQSERVVYHTNDADTASPPILVGLRDPIKPGSLIKDDDMVASLTVKSGDKISELDSANEQVVADSLQLTGSIDTAGEKALAKEGHEDIEAFVESTSMKKSDMDNKETHSHAVESINVGGLVNEPEHDSHVITSDGTLEHASSKELMPLLSESTEVSDELRDGQLSKVLVESVDSEISNSTMHEALNENGTCKNETFTDTTGHVGATKSQSSDKLTTNKEEEKDKDIEAEPDKTEVSEPPPFTTLVQSGGEVHVETCSSEIENSQNNQQSKSSALQVGSFPSLTNVVDESEGMKEKKETVEKVTESSPAIQHNPLKALLDEVKSPNTKHDQKEEAKSNDDAAHSTTVKSILDEEAVKDQETGKDVEEQNSPARYPIENTKAKKKKKKSYWAPFMCCSSVHRDTYEQL